MTVPDFATEIRRIVLTQSKLANVGHIGSALSIAEIMAAIYDDGGARIADPGDPARDRVILSKGHAALALYACLHLRGWLDFDALQTFCADRTALGVHPEHALRGIDFSTGSLGQGLSFAVGAALAARMSGSPRRTFVVLSDGECNEGAVWEAAMFAAHHHLSNLIAIVDVNGQQAFGYTADVLDQTEIAARWKAFGWDVADVDGHSVQAIQNAFSNATGAPRVVIARTTFGKGVSFMERQIKWHYLPMSDAEYDAALQEVSAR